MADDEVKKTNIKNIPAFEKKFGDSLATFKVSKKNAQQVIQCLNDLKPDEAVEAAIVQVQPAESAKEALRKDFDDICATASELKDALKARGDDDTSINEKVKFNRLDEMENVGNINIDLDKIVNIQKLNSSRNMTSSSSPILSSTIKEPESGSGAPIKLKNQIP